MLHVSVLQYKDFNDCIRGYAGIRLVSIPNTPPAILPNLPQGVGLYLIVSSDIYDSY